jgi:hypothetical protein
VQQRQHHAAQGVHRIQMAGNRHQHLGWLSNVTLPAAFGGAAPSWTTKWLRPWSAPRLPTPSPGRRVRAPGRQQQLRSTANITAPAPLRRGLRHAAHKTQTMKHHPYGMFLYADPRPPGPIQTSTPPRCSASPAPTAPPAKAFAATGAARPSP